MTPCGLSRARQRCPCVRWWVAAAERRGTDLEERDHVVVDKVPNHPLHPHAVVRVARRIERLQTYQVEIADVAALAEVSARLRDEVLYWLHDVDCRKALHEHAARDAPHARAAVHSARAGAACGSAAAQRGKSVEERCALRKIQRRNLAVAAEHTVDSRRDAAPVRNR